jgi:hypothetical protein
MQPLLFCGFEAWDQLQLRQHQLLVSLLIVAALLAIQYWTLQTISCTAL